MTDTWACPNGHAAARVNAWYDGDTGQPLTPPAPAPAPAPATAAPGTREAFLKAVEAERVVYLWEWLKERSSGLNFGGFESESYSTFGTKRSGTKKEVVFGAARLPREGRHPEAIGAVVSGCSGAFGPL